MITRIVITTTMPAWGRPCRSRMSCLTRRVAAWTLPRAQWRPCSGAIVLVFCAGEGLFWAGVVATFVMGVGTAITVAAIATIAVGAKAWAARFAETRSGYGMLAMRGIEVGAAVVIIAFGSLLLAGFMASERLVGM
jgi:hypothetical protein